MNKQADRYLHHLERFKAAMDKALAAHRKNPLEPVGHHLYLADGRTPMFQLQGLARIEKKAGRNPDIAEGWLYHAKEIEDGLGKYDYWMAMIESNRLWKFPDPIDNHFRSQASQALGVLEERLQKLGWLDRDHNGIRSSDRGMRDFRRSLKKARWSGQKKERKQLLALLRDESMEIHYKITRKELDLDHVELGIHEFRRNTRWLGIYSSALMGKVRLDRSKGIEPLSHFVTADRVSYKHNKLPFNDAQKDPVHFLPGAFYAMSDLIAGIGDIKDPGLATEEMMHLGKLFGLSTSTIKRHLGRDHYPHEKVVKDAKTMIIQFVERERVYEEMAAHFDKQLK
jgi:hypothetical protein